MSYPEKLKQLEEQLEKLQAEIEKTTAEYRNASPIKIGDKVTFDNKKYYVCETYISKWTKHEIRFTICEPKKDGVMPMKKIGSKMNLTEEQLTLGWN